MKLKLLSQKDGPHIRLFKTIYKTYLKTSTNQKSDVVVLDSGDAANVIALTKERDILLVKQFRYGIEKFTVEIPGGFVDRGETALHAVKRELLEETGYASQEWHYLGKFPSNPVFQNSYIHHFVAFNVKRMQLPKLDPAEVIESVFLPLDQLEQKLNQAYFQHPHTVSAFSLAKSLLQSKFTKEH